VSNMRTPKNILKHELIGLECKIVSSKNKSQVGVNGKIVDETLKTIVIMVKNKKKRIPKKDTIFRLSLGKQKVDINGNYILARPEDRIKKIVRKW